MASELRKLQIRINKQSDGERAEYARLAYHFREGALERRADNRERVQKTGHWRG